MIKVHPLDDKHIGLEINGSDFRSALTIIKYDLVVREYIKGETNIWKIPLRDLGRLVKLCKAENVKIKLVDESIRSQYLNLYNYVKTLSSLKNKDATPIKEMDNLKMSLRPFQTLGAYFAYLAKNALIGDPVGLGKTPQSLAVSQRLRDEKATNFTIVLCSSTLKRNWGPEIEKFTDWKYCIVEGSFSKRKKVYRQAVYHDAMIIGYEILHRDWDAICKYICEKGFEFHLIIDEIQYIKNYKALRSKFTKRLQAYAKYTTGLSATSYENSPLDLFSIYLALDLTVYGKSIWMFKERYIVEDYWGKTIGVSNLESLRARKAPTFIRRQKEDVLTELPDRIENDYWINLSKEQRDIYSDIKNRIVEEIKDQEKAGKIQMADILPMMTYLRMVAQSSALITHKRGVSTKLDELVELINLCEDIKVVVFCTFVKMVETIKSVLDSRGVSNYGIHGGNTPSANRVEIIQAFNKDPGVKVLITSDILREGVNITSANYLVNFDILPNPARMEQRIGRIDRIGNKHSKINIINFIAKDTVEERLYEIYKAKKDAFKQVIDGGVTEARMTLKSVKSLLEIG